MTLSDFNERKERKIDRYSELAKKNKNLSETLFQKSQQMAEVIPMGQPILIGHHSEKRDRNYRERMNRTFEKSIEADDKSKYYEKKISSLQNERSIFQDDPDALEKLQEKLKKCEKFQESAKTINKIIRKKIPDQDKIKLIVELGYPEEVGIEFLKPDFAGRVGIPAYELTNNNAEIRRLKLRLKEIQDKRTLETTEIEIGDIRVVDSAEENRIMIFFPGKPEEEIRKKLKSSGFRWSPSSGAWQAFRNNRARYYIDQIVADIVRKDLVLPAYVNPENYLFIGDDG